jgi:NAD(P)-dependent dehydrogenase (short-subunit alcohol dehydrogenase family)
MKFPEELEFIKNSFLSPKISNAGLRGKVCLISGATSGIGYETAKKMAKGGAHIVLICRNPEKADTLQKQLIDDFDVKVDVFIADFERLEEVQQAALKIRKSYPSLHILINNAGVFNKRRRLTADGNEMTFGVIHLASLLLTRLLLDNLQRGAPSRVLFITSEAHRFGGFNINDLNWNKRIYVGLLSYGSAKIAQIHTTLLLADKFKDTGVSFNLVHPGAVRTNIGMNNGFLYRFYSKHILKWFLKDPNRSAEAIYYLAADPSQECTTGKFYNLTTEEKPAWYSVNPKLRALVWDKSNEFIQKYLGDVYGI